MDNKYSISNVLNEYNKMNKERVKGSDILFKVIVFFIMMSIINFGITEILSLFDSPIISTMQIILLPFINMLLIIGLSVAYIDYYIHGFEFNLQSAFNVFKHKKRVLLISQFFIIEIIKIIIGVVVFIPIIYLIISDYKISGNIYFSIMYVLKDHLYKILFFLITELTIYHFIINSFNMYYYTVYYNSLIDEFSGFFWNFNGSIQMYFKDINLLIKSIVIELLLSIFTLLSFGLAIGVVLSLGNSQNALQAIMTTNMLRYLIFFIMMMIEVARFIFINKLIAKKIKMS